MANRPAPESVAVLVISRDDSFVASLGDALQQSRELLHAPNMASAETLVIAHRIGVIVTDRGTTHEDIRAVTSRLRPLAPDIVVVVAGDRSHGNELMDLITSGDIYRFLLTPLAPGQTRVCIESAVTRFLEARGSDSVTVEEPTEAPARNLVPWLAGAVVVALAGGVWLAVAPGTDEPSPVPVPAAGSTGSELPRDASLQHTLSLARQALDEEHYIEPIGANALYFYRSVLAAEPGNSEALQGLEAVTTALLGLARDAISTGDISAAETALNAVRGIAPEHPELAELRAGITTLSVQAAILAADEAASRRDFQSALALLNAQPATPATNAARARIDAARRADLLDTHLQAAAGRMASGQLIEPANDSAHFHVLAATTLAPDSPQAASAAGSLTALLVARAEQAAAAGQFNTAQAMLDAAATLSANSAAVEAARPGTQAAVEAAREKAALAAISTERLALARERLQARQLLEPGGDSAYDYVTLVRESDAENPALAAAETQLAQALFTDAQRLTAEGQYGEAGTRLDAAAELGAGAGAVAAARQAIASARAAQATPAPAVPAYISTQQLTRTRYVPPVYPSVARRRGQEGTVLLEFTLGTDGTTADIQVIESRPGRVFDRAAVNALSRWQFEPYSINGEPQEVRVRVDMAFVLE